MNSLSPSVRGMLWMVAAGLQFAGMNALLKKLTHELDPWMVGWLRYSLGVLIILPAVLRSGVGTLWPKRPGLQFQRGLFHAAGLAFWFAALPLISLSELTAISFSGPLFICIGAALFLKERMSGARWAAVLVGFSGVLLVVQPWEGGFGGISYGMLIMLGAPPLFAASLLMAKLLTRDERSDMIVLWQHLWVAILFAPFALASWAMPSAGQWALLLLGAILGSGGHYCNTRAFAVADISAVQTVKFLDLVWASLLGIALFGSFPGAATMLGGMVILFSTLWLAKREARGT